MRHAHAMPDIASAVRKGGSDHLLPAYRMSAAGLPPRQISSPDTARPPLA